jgi:hypothetical protein
MATKALEAMRRKLEEHDPFLEGANLDTRGLPGFRHGPGKEESFIDDRFGGMVAENRHSLRESIGALVGSNDAEVNAVLETAGIQNPYAPSTVHVGDEPFQVYFKDGLWRGKGAFNGELHQFTGKDRDAVLGKIMALAERETIRDLTPDEELHITRLAQSGDEATAFGQYFLSRIGPQVATMEDPLTELLSNPKYRSVCDEAAYFIWAARNDNYVPDAKFEEMLARVAETKPLNARLITSVYVQYLDERQTRSPEPQPEPNELQQSLEDLDDEAIQRLYWTTAKHVARGGR